jgi:hypothetical protein
MGFLMTKSSPNFIDSRSAGLARVRLRVPKNNSQPAPQRLYPAKINATALYRISLAFYLYPNAVPGHLPHNTIPIVRNCTAATRFSPTRFIPS